MHAEGRLNRTKNAGSSLSLPGFPRDSSGLLFPHIQEGSWTDPGSQLGFFMRDQHLPLTASLGGILTT